MLFLMEKGWTLLFPLAFKFNDYESENSRLFFSLKIGIFWS